MWSITVTTVGVEYHGFLEAGRSCKHGYLCHVRVLDSLREFVSVFRWCLLFRGVLCRP